MRYMEVYPNGTMTMALTSMGIAAEWHAKTRNYDKEMALDDDKIFVSFPEEEASSSSSSLDIESSGQIQIPGRAVVRDYATTPADISEMLGETFCA
jgi:hypothetical protein